MRFPGGEYVRSTDSRRETLGMVPPKRDLGIFCYCNTSRQYPTPRMVFSTSPLPDGLQSAAEKIHKLSRVSLLHVVVHSPDPGKEQGAGKRLTGIAGEKFRVSAPSRLERVHSFLSFVRRRFSGSKATSPKVRREDIPLWLGRRRLERMRARSSSKAKGFTM